MLVGQTNYFNILYEIIETRNLVCSQNRLSELVFFLIQGYNQNLILYIEDLHLSL